MNKLNVNIPNRSYDIIIGKDLLKTLGENVKKISPKAKKAIVVTDSNVAPLYADAVICALNAAGIISKLVTLPAGEQTKSLDSLSNLYSEAFSFKITRSDVAIALGGGVIGDLTGFFASTVLRGIDFYQVPTTLLAQVDSSVGGKVAINVDAGKNLVGAFYQPKLVVIDTLTLSTLSDEIFSDGMAEVIKYGFIKDENLLSLLENCGGREKATENIEKIIYTCCDIKRKIVESDEFDTGERMILNFGHTLGHVIEKQYNFSVYTHGKAVGYGMILAAALGEKKGITQGGTAERIKKVLTLYALPTHIEIDKNLLFDILCLDKKSSGSSINFVFVKKCGEAFYEKTDSKILCDEIAKII